MAKQLSPAAKAVLDATNEAYDQAATVAQGTAVALRAAADQGEIFFDAYDSPVRVVTVDDLLAIAHELESQ